ncbi:PAS domain-containing sensor histidine kinase [Nocardioides campestrisoli]|uniref:PAS domain-containing sensor histidine kinase n=1 Tax=Nocardioides campestrisoli TaxID=2736757 RepID=UPI0015E6B53F|nr:ATP-binding protein [Nocardioides campestrisoli]
MREDARPRGADSLSARSSPAEARERYRSLFTHIPQAAFALDREGRLQAANPEGCRRAGYTEPEMIGMSFLTMVAEEDHERALAAFQEVLAGRPRTLECRLHRADGEHVDTRLTVIPVVVGGEVTGVHGVVDDVTARKQELRDLEEARRVAVEASLAKSIFLSNVSHELRTPLAAMVAALEMLEDVDLPPPGAPLLATAQRAGERLRRLVDDVVDFHALSKAEARSEPAPFDPRQVVVAAVAAVAPAAEATGLTLAIEVAEPVPVRLVGDAPRFAQALDILLDNAVKFTARGRVRVRVGEVPATGRKHGRHRSDDANEGPLCVLRVEVSDTGIGVTPEQHSVLFDPFVQGDGSVTRRYAGTGLGLAILRELVGLMGGTYGLTSTPGAGTTVELILPFQAVAPA